MIRRILLADNDTMAAETVKETAKTFGATVFEAGDIEEAFRVYIEKGPDIVVAASLLPKRGAFELFRRIRSSVGGERVALLVTSSFTGAAQLREEAIGEWQALEVLEKPLLGTDLEREFTRVMPKIGVHSTGSNILWGAIDDEGGFDRETFPLLVAHAMLKPEPCGLAVWHGKTKKLLSFSGGELSFAHSNRFAETLGRHLLARGVVTEQAYDEAVQMAVGGNIRIGEAFIRLGHADAETIDSHVRRNILDKVAETFTWRSGYYRFAPYQAPPAQIPGGNISCESLLWMMVCEQMSEKLVTGSMAAQGEMRLHLERKGHPLPGREILGSMTGEIPRLLAQCDGRTLGSVMETVEKKFYKPIYFLILCGFLAPETGGDEAEEQKVKDKGLKELQERLEWLTGRNFFQVLDTPLQASDEEVREAYERLCEELDEVQTGNASSGEAALLKEQIRDLFDRAELALSTSQARGNYLASLEGEVAQEEESLEQVAAEAVFREGQGFLRQRLWMAAYDKFTKAADLNPDEPEYVLYRGVALMRDDSGSDKKDYKEAEEILKQAHRAMPQSAEPLYQLGVLAQKIGNHSVAKELFERAMKAEPSHERTRRRLESLSESAKKFGLFKK